MAEIVRLARPEETPRPLPGEFVKTATAREITQSLNLVRSLDGGGVTMIAGASGIGKTITLERFAKDLGRDAFYMRVAKGEGRPWALAYNIFATGWGPHEERHFLGGGLAKARERLARCLGPDKVLLIDEAQHLNEFDDKTRLTGAGFEWLRACQELGGFSLVFCGDLTLPEVMDKAAPHVMNRARRPLVLKAADKADVGALAECWGVRDAAALKALAEVAKMRGGLRNVVNVLNLAQDFGGGVATPVSIKAAIETEGFALKGGV